VYRVRVGPGSATHVCGTMKQCLFSPTIPALLHLSYVLCVWILSKQSGIKFSSGLESLPLRMRLHLLFFLDAGSVCAFTCTSRTLAATGMCPPFLILYANWFCFFLLIPYSLSPRHQELDIVWAKLLGHDFESLLRDMTIRSRSGFFFVFLASLVVFRGTRKM